jgi:hypothetical protein
MTGLPRILFLALILLTSAPFVAHAQDKIEKPSKESVVAAWEETLKNSEYTLKFAATDKPGVYDFETTLFPYKGALKLVNVVVAPPDYTYDISEADAPWRGYIEYELINAPKDFFQHYYRSYAEWGKLNEFYYATEPGKWLSAPDMKAYLAVHKPATDLNCAVPATSKPFMHVLNELTGLIPVAFFMVALLALLLLFTRKQRKTQIANYNLTIERQLEMLNTLKDIREQLKQGK